MSLTRLVTNARCLLIDFDGPVCSVFTGYPATAVAEDLHELIRRRFSGALPTDLLDSFSDPLRTLVEVAAIGDEQLTREAADVCRDGEVTAVASAAPTPGAEDVLRFARDSGRLVAIVSNNATEAISTYLTNHGLTPYIDGVAGRADGMHPRLLKPHPFLLDTGLTAAGADRDEAIFVGDSVTDVEAGLAAGIPVIGYANKPGKRQRLTAAGADVVIESMQALADVLRQVPARPSR